jgi:hypothetical protein
MNDNAPVPSYLRVGPHTGGRAKTWCLFVHAKSSLSISLSYLPETVGHVTNAHLEPYFRE